jgi:23S rRNA (pseudouridine1915-N3)-methyltransferase
LKLWVIAVGHRMPAWIDTAFEDYARRMPREAQIKLVEIKAEPRHESDHSGRSRRLTEAEARRITAAIPIDAYRVVLDERGREWSTRELASELEKWQMRRPHVAFIIGGADGLHESVRRAADWIWSLSRLTLPHALVRVVVAEQIYRAYSILRNHPYHRD